MASVLRFPDVWGKAPPLRFTRPELTRLLNLYTKRVMTGEWRDYAISFSPGMASFFIFRHSHENPLFVISKVDSRGGKAARHKHSRFLVTSHERKLSQGNDLDQVLAIFNSPLRLITG